MRKLILSILGATILLLSLEAQEPTKETAFKLIKNDKGLSIVINNQSFGPYESLIGPPLVYPQSKLYIIPLRKNKTENWFLVNGKEYGPFKGEWVNYMDFSPDGSSWFASLAIKSGKGEINDFVINGKLYPDMGMLERSEFLTNDNYYLLFSLSKDNRFMKYVVTPQAKLGPWEDIFDILFLDAKLVIIYRNKNQTFLYYNGQNLGPFDQVEPIIRKPPKAGPPAPEAKAITGFILKGKNKSLVFLPNLQLSYEQIHYYYFSPDGLNWLVFAEQGGKRILNLNGSETTYEWLDIREEAGHFLLRGRKDKNSPVVLMLDGREVGSYQDVRDILISPTGDWGAVIRVERGESSYMQVLINGKEYDGDSLRLVKNKEGLFFVWLSYDKDNQVYINSLKISK